MVTPFEFATAGRILFGEGKLRELGAAAAQFGWRALLVTGANPQRAEPAVRMLAEHGVECTSFAISGEPSTDAVTTGAAVARESQCAVVIGFGGGSAIDGAKAIAALATNPGSVFDYLEVIGKAQPLTQAPLPVIAIPTTAGAGAEVTRNAVLTSREHRVKASLRHQGLLPRVAIVDPTLTHALPAHLTATTGMDALTQLIEPFVCARANPFVDALCRDAIPRVARSLPRAFADGADSDARSEVALASLFGGLALANAGLGAVHGFAAPIGGMFPAPHGAVCAALLPAVITANVRTARAEPRHAVGERYAEVARMLTGRPNAVPDDAVQFVDQLRHNLGIPRLREFSIKSADFEEIARNAAKSSSMKANPVTLPHDVLIQILNESW